MELNKSNLDWSLLLPNNPMSLLEIKGSLVLSSLFIYLLIFILLFLLIYIFVRALEYRKWIKKLTYALDEVNEDNIVQFRQYLIDLNDKNTYVGKQWNEFDETLVLSHDGEKLYNTVDASYFFNLQTLAQRN